MVTLAAIQFDPQFGQKEENVKRTIELICKVADQGANVITLPELCNTGYVFNTREECFSLMEKVPEGPTTQAWMEIAKERGVYISGGLGEMGEDGKAYNSCVLVGPDGFIGKHRKLHLWEDDKVFFEPGDLGHQVFQTPIGRIGMLICNDMWYFESFRLLALMGADVVLCPTNWVVEIDGPAKTLGPQLCMTNAGCNNMFVVAADRVGIERGCEFPGMSCIVGTDGWYRAGPASEDKEEVLVATVNLMAARRLHMNNMNVVFRDRRTDLYDEMLGSGLKSLPR